MENIRIDTEGNFRCWKCDSKNFDEKRTSRSKAAIGVEVLLTHKKLKCQDCGEYNDTGSVRPPKTTFAERMEANRAAILAKKEAKR